MSESGLAMQLAKSLADDEFTELRFQLSLSNSWIETRGRIAWLNGTKNKAGVEFVEMPDDGRALLNKWIASSAPVQTEEAPAESAVSVETAPELEPATLESAEPVAEATQISEPTLAESAEPVQPATGDAAQALDEAEASGAAPDVEPAMDDEVRALRAGFTLYSPEAVSRWGIREDAIAGDPAKTRSRIWVLVGVAIVVLMAAFLGITLWKAANRRSSVSSSNRFETSPAGVTNSATKRIPTADASGESFAGIAAQPAGRDSASDKGASGAATANEAERAGKSTERGPERLRVAPPGQAATPRDSSGFVLQVGAMSDQANALSLADTLRRRKFPVFVIKPPADPLYRVLVGPYGDAKSAASGAAELRQQGFQSIRKPNTAAR